MGYRRRNIGRTFSNIFTIIIIVVAIIIYRKYDFNFYTKGILGEGKTKFSRDSDVRYSKMRSYKIENVLENDAIFFKSVEVKPNSTYKVSCMVKTEDVESSDNNPVAGAQIYLLGTEEHSEVLTGDNDWTKLTFYFNSKNNTNVEIGFRLGENQSKVSGTAWFSDLKIEKGAQDDDNTWNIGCFIIDNADVEINGEEVKLTMSYSQKRQVENDMKKFQGTIREISNNKINITYEVVEVVDTLTTLTYEEENGYYISEKDVYNLINDYVQTKEFDHIFICSNLPLDSNNINTSVSDWIGLGNMEYCGKGLSDVRIMDENYNYSSKDTFSEEVYIHEFLHTLERNAKENGYEIPALHDYGDYGYKEDRYYGLKQWYKDYILCNIKYNDTTVGLPEEILTLKPPTSELFKFTTELDLLDEPKNIKETIQSIMIKVKKLFNKDETKYVVGGAAE